MVNWEAFEQEVGDWAVENFGEQPSVNPFLGTAEELSELAELFVEEVDGEWMEKEVTEEEIDAVGDVLVFFADFCSRHEISYAKAAEQRHEIDLKTECDSVETLCVELTISRGQQAYSFLKQDQGIRLERDGVGKEADERGLAYTLRALEEFINARGYTFDDAIEEAWGEVKDREWDSNYN